MKILDAEKAAEMSELFNNSFDFTLASSAFTLTRSFIASRSALLHSFYFIPDSHEI
jgi:hypothetical protein